MRIADDRFFHLTYCTNIHPGESWEAVFAGIERYVPGLKQRLSPQKPFGIGLRLSDLAARELLQGDALDGFKTWLGERGLYVFTINGFPYGGFHRQVVKDQVYAPDWRAAARVDYTLRLARILAALLPADIEGSISSVPISYKPWFHNEAERAAAFERASVNLARMAAELMSIRATTGRSLHIDVEPEPDCLLENSDETVEFFERWLLPVGGSWLASTLCISPSEAQANLLAHIGVCYDTCHFALQYETPAAALSKLTGAGIRIGKVQLSAALKASMPESADERGAVIERLRPFAEPTYLHQIVERHADGSLHHHADLSTATSPHPDAREWRVHFHVPIFSGEYGGIYSTRDDIAATLSVLRDTHACPHLEIETYTWEVLPSRLKVDLSRSIVREYEWVLNTFAPPPAH
ncbi:MAG: metabolite traffic protein EboE [Gammaproteobacteria bacterium]|nr:metabolite traffic protein EboE [Gammaproteobacteria bacterium]